MRNGGGRLQCAMVLLLTCQVPEGRWHELLAVREDERKRHDVDVWVAPRGVPLQRQVDVVAPSARIQVRSAAVRAGGDAREALRHGIRSEDGPNVHDRRHRVVIPAKDPCHCRRWLRLEPLVGASGDCGSRRKECAKKRSPSADAADPLPTGT